MSVLNLNKMFQPGSVALVGASDKHDSLGHVVMKNLLAGEFAGPIMPVNPKYRTVSGVQAYPDIASLPLEPDLAVICTPANTVAGIISELGQRGTRAAVVLSAGFRTEGNGRTLEQELLDAAKPYGLRILGPNCVGLLIPAVGLNASFAHTGSLPGKLALVSQSGALCTTILDWARSRGIGFSCFISLGDSADVDFGDLLDYLAGDASTRGILLYMESVKLARKFMSAARATSRNKPVIVIKAGRVAEGAKAATSHTGALAGSDEVFDAAIRRAGMLRVYTIGELFDAVETLAHGRRVPGNRLAILTNGGGPGVLATDSLVIGGGKLAELSEDTITELDRVLPATWSRANPVDIIGDGGAERYISALKILLGDPNYDAILVMLVPVAVIDNSEVARAVATEINNTHKPVLTCWMGEDGVAEARMIFEKAAIPSYDTPESAIQAFLQLVEYDRNKVSLMETPPSITGGTEQQGARECASGIITAALGEERSILTEPEAKAILAAYGIPVVETRVAKNVEQALDMAESLGFPVALKILSADITHKSDVGGVLLGIESRDILQAAAEGMLARVARLQAGARLDGFSVQKMAHRPGAFELIVGVASDPIFGPVVLFGQGGTSVEILNDKAVALPPLNMKLANDLVRRTRISRLLSGYRNVAAADLDAINRVLVQVSQLLIDNPEILELDINPLLADSNGVIALDARICVRAGAERLVIRPYPQELEESVTLDNGMQLLLRPIRPEDESAHHEFLHRTDADDIYFRFFRAASHFSHPFLARFTQIDYDREMAFIASLEDGHNEPETLGVVRAVADADNNEAEIAIIVRSDRHGLGIGSRLMKKMIDYCRGRGTKRLTGQVLRQNAAMIRLSERSGFQVLPDAGPGVVAIRLEF